MEVESFSGTDASKKPPEAVARHLEVIAKQVVVIAAEIKLTRRAYSQSHTETEDLPDEKRTA